MSRYDQKKMDAKEIIREANYLADKKTSEKHRKFESQFGTFGKYILEAGTGGGFTAIPHAIDIYQAALGLSIDEAWYMKILCKYLPNVFPNMAKVAKETGVHETKLSRIKNAIIRRTGFIRDAGKHSNEKLQRDLNIMPFFDAVFLCILCDPNSKVVTGQAMDKVRTEFTAYWQGNKEAEYYVKQEAFCFIDLPLSIEVAKKFAETRKIILNWSVIHEMQNGAAVEKLENMKVDKMRMLEIKDAINAGRGEAFGIVYNFGKCYEWLKRLACTPISPNEIERLTREYVEISDMPTAKGYMEQMDRIIEMNRKMLAEREVYYAAAYAE